MQVRKCNMRRSVIMRAACAMVAAGLWLASAPAFAAAPTQVEFDWSVTTGTGASGTGNGGMNNSYTPSPVLTDQSVDSVYAFLSSRSSQNSSLPLAVKITSPISAATAAKIFNHFNIKYVFADLEVTGTSQINTLVSQVRASGSQSKSAFIGDFGYYPNTGTDQTQPQNINTTASSFKNGSGTPTGAGYSSAKLNMSNEVAYPGSPGQISASAAGAPNIRSALFVLPIREVTYATTFLATNSYPLNLNSQPVVSNSKTGENIPWIARFDNWGNDDLSNDGNNGLGTPGTSHNPSTTSSAGYRFAFNTDDPSHPQYANQLLSRGDFSAQVLTYRLRGASSFNLFNYDAPYASVIGYTAAQQQTDATAGWNGGGNSTLSAIWGRNNFAYANLVNNVPLLKTTGSGKTLKQTEVDTSSTTSGTVLSGIYDLAGSTRQLALLVSNMDAVSHTLDFVYKYGGASVNLGTLSGAGPLDQYYTVAPGTHDLLTFNLTNGKWVLFANDEVFADSNRNGIGVPEPTSLALLGLTGFGLLLRRRRTPQ
ncbi:MAG TPA: PEP-CTERM sorting domain-containing protein [Tepidisphaeraceae bacterium]|jgi:hypothetical protein|nr:PEP-CTERM sorting domain-containing protein [Tepidisphaeraceae bacterium]